VTTETEKDSELRRFIDSLSEQTKKLCLADLEGQIHRTIQDLTDLDLDMMMNLGELAWFVQLVKEGQYE